jgi:hypothetical protein
MWTEEHRWGLSARRRRLSERSEDAEWGRLEQKITQPLAPFHVIARNLFRLLGVIGVIGNAAQRVGEPGLRIDTFSDSRPRARDRG